jgi:hypothetical protein
VLPLVVIEWRISRYDGYRKGLGFHLALFGIMIVGRARLVPYGGMGLGEVFKGVVSSNYSLYQ